MWKPLVALAGTIGLAKLLRQLQASVVRLQVFTGTSRTKVADFQDSRHAGTSLALAGGFSQCSSQQ